MKKRAFNIDFMYKINAQEIDNVSKLKPFERYKYFVKRVADFETLYTLKKEEDIFAISEIENEKLIPFWFPKEFAELNLIDGWKDFYVKEISLEEFEDEIIEMLLSEKFLLNIFPINNKTGFVVSLNEFMRDLGEELSNY